MIKIIKLSHPDCTDCMGASYRPNECIDCTKAQEVVMCKDCVRKDESVMHREKLLCTKLHAWVEPCDFCAWGERKEKK